MFFTYLLIAVIILLFTWNPLKAFLWPLNLIQYILLVIATCTLAWALK